MLCSSLTRLPSMHAHPHTAPHRPRPTHSLSLEQCQAHIIAAQNARAVEESLKALGASGDSENSGPKPADEGFLSYLRSFLFPANEGGEAGQPAAEPTGPVAAFMARVGAVVERARKGAGGKAGVDAAATAIAIAPSPGKGGKKKEKEVSVLECVWGRKCCGD